MEKDSGEQRPGPRSQTRRGKQHSEQSAPISNRVMTCLHPPGGWPQAPFYAVENSVPESDQNQ